MLEKMSRRTFLIVSEQEWYGNYEHEREGKQTDRMNESKRKPY